MPVELAPGEQLGQYRIIAPIGRGGMATVYKAFQPTLARYVAIKVLPILYAEDPYFLERFRREARIISQLRHSNILAVFDFGAQGELTYMVSEFLPGGTLESYLGRPLPIAEAVKLLGPIARALDYAHGRGVVHRDVKPSNILLAEDGTPVLADFGLAHLLAGSASLTASGVLIGTPLYMAPEQAAGEQVTPASDRYSLGVVLFHALTGRPPFEAESPIAVALAHVHKPLPLPRALNPGLPQAAEATLLKALAKDPAARFDSASAMIAALERGELTASPVETTVTTPGSLGSTLVPTGPRTSRRWRPISLLGGGVGAILLAIGLAYLLSSGSSPLPATTNRPVGENVIVNPSFEEGGRSPRGWEPGVPGGGEPRAHFEWSTAQSHAGHRSVAIGRPEAGAVWAFIGPEASGLDRAIKVPEAATTAQVAVWCKTDDPTMLTPAPPAQGASLVNQPYIRLVAIREDGAYWGFPQFGVRCASAWTENRFSARIPGDVAHVSVWLGFDGPSQATVWFDDLSLSFY